MIPANILLFILFVYGVAAFANKKINDHYAQKEMEKEMELEAIRLNEEIVDDGVLIDMVDEDHDYGFIVSDD